MTLFKNKDEKRTFGEWLTEIIKLVLVMKSVTMPQLRELCGRQAFVGTFSHDEVLINNEVQATS